MKKVCSVSGNCMMNSQCVLKLASLCASRCILKCWICCLAGSRNSGIQQTNPDIPDTSVIPVYILFKFMAQDLSPVISLLHPSTNSSTSQSLFCFSFSLAVILYDATTSYASQVGILILFLTHTAFLLISPTLPLSSVSICNPVLTVSQFLLRS